MVWAWMQREPYALGARRRLWFGHGCKGNRMLLEHEGDSGWGMDAKGNRMLLEHGRDYGLDMDVKGTVCSWNTKEIMVWAWM